MFLGPILKNFLGLFTEGAVFKSPMFSFGKLPGESIQGASCGSNKITDDMTQVCSVQNLPTEPFDDTCVDWKFLPKIEIIGALGTWMAWIYGEGDANIPFTEHLRAMDSTYDASDPQDVTTTFRMRNDLQGSKYWLQSRLLESLTNNKTLVFI